MRSPTLVVAAAVSVAVLLLSQPVLAQDEATARRHFQRAERYYERGEYRVALQHFEAAYAAAPFSAFLFNMAQCNRLIGNDAEAVVLYRRFLREAYDPPNRALVEELIAELERGRPPPGSPSTPSQARPPMERTLPPPATGSEPRHRPVIARIRPATWLTMTGGAVLLGVGGLFALQASNAESDLGNPRLDCSADLPRCLELKDDGDRASVLRNVFVWTGVAALATSTLLFVLDASADDPGVQNARLVPVLQPAGLALAWRSAGW